MEIIVRKNDLVKELLLVQGIVERKNSIPILSNVLCEARGSELRISATDLDVSLRCGCAAQVVKEGKITLAAKKLHEIARSLPESDVQIRGAARGLGRDRVRAQPLQDGGPARRGLPDPARGEPRQGGGDPGRGPARPDRPHRLRHHRRRRALLPGGRPPAAGQGRRGHGGHRRPPAVLRAEHGRARGEGAPAGAGAPQGHRASSQRLLEGEEAATFQQVDNHLVFTVGAACSPPR